MRVWTERRDGRWDQCTECSYLMILAWAGHEPFPLGVYTTAERDSFDAAHEPDDPNGGATFNICDKGSTRRYGLKLRMIADGSKAGLRRELETPGNGLAIAGRLSHFPGGHRLRRWQPFFIGGHAVAVINDGRDELLWLDPLAPDGFAGDRVSIDDVLTFAWYPSDARVARKDEHKPMFTDVPSNHWAAADIEWADKHGLLSGFVRPDGKREFRPDAMLTRGQAAALTRRIMREVKTAIEAER